MQVLKDFIQPKIKFAASSGVATIVDTIVFSVMHRVFDFAMGHSQVAGATTGMLINFFLQKKYVFLNNRKTRYAFLLSISFSILGIVFSKFFITWLSAQPLISAHWLIPKVIVTGTLFIYNFYTKRWAFEKRVKGW